MDPREIELRIKQWIPIIEEQAKNGLSKTECCFMHGVDCTTFSDDRYGSRHISLNNGETRPPKLI